MVTKTSVQLQCCPMMSHLTILTCSLTPRPCSASLLDTHQHHLECPPCPRSPPKLAGNCFLCVLWMQRSLLTYVVLSSLENHPECVVVSNVKRNVERRVPFMKKNTSSNRSKSCVKRPPLCKVSISMMILG